MPKISLVRVAIKNLASEYNCYICGSGSNLVALKQYITAAKFAKPGLKDTEIEFRHLTSRRNEILVLEFQSKTIPVGFTEQAFLDINART